MIVCIIPARKGSKRIKNKNTKNFFGKPIIEHVIKKVKSSNVFDKIIVSSDSRKILNLSSRIGAEPFLRSSKLSKDNIPIKSVIADVISYYKKKNINFDKVCCIFPTSVFFSIKDLIVAKKKLKKGVHFVFSAVQYNHPIQRSFSIKKEKLIMNFSGTEKMNTQSFSDSYHDAAQFYFGWNSSWLQNKPIFSGNNKFIKFNELKAHDIDTIEDWKIAEIKYQILKKNEYPDINK